MRKYRLLPYPEGFARARYGMRFRASAGFPTVNTGHAAIAATGRDPQDIDEDEEQFRFMANPRMH